MNKRVVAITWLLLYLLICCTLFSGKIQEEMTILVKGYQKTSSKETGSPMRIDWRAIYTEYNEENGLYEDHLYEVQEGFGWEQGLRCRNVKGFGIDPINGIASVTMNRDAFLVLAASRNPQEGKLAKIVEEFDTGEDAYLYYYPNKLPPNRDFPQNMAVLGETDHSILTTVADAEFPFLPHTAKTWTATTDYAKKVYSLTEAEVFLKQIPLVMAAFMIAASGILFWACGSVSGMRGIKRGIWSNAMAVCAALIALRIVFWQIDLPASTLPSANIFDLAHYREEYSLILDALRELGMTDHSIFQTIAHIKSQCGQLILGAGMFAVTVLTLEVFCIFPIRIGSRKKSTI